MYFSIKHLKLFIASKLGGIILKFSFSYNTTALIWKVVFSFLIFLS